MKHVYKFFAGLLALLAAILIGICCIVLLPIDYIKYRRSLVYKTEHIKYRLFAASSIHFELYNEILENSLPIRFVANPEEYDLSEGYFLYQNTLIIPNEFSFEHDSQSDMWNYCCEDEKSVVLSLDEYLDLELHDVNKLAGSVICDHAVVLVEESCVDNADLAKGDARFLVYNGDRAEVLKEFCNRMTPAQDQF